LHPVAQARRESSGIGELTSALCDRRLGIEERQLAAPSAVRANAASSSEPNGWGAPVCASPSMPRQEPMCRLEPPEAADMRERSVPQAVRQQRRAMGTCPSKPQRRREDAAPCCAIHQSQHVAPASTVCSGVAASADVAFTQSSGVVEHGSSALSAVHANAASSALSSCTLWRLRAQIAVAWISLQVQFLLVAAAWQA